MTADFIRFIPPWVTVVAGFAAGGPLWLVACAPRAAQEPAAAATAVIQEPWKVPGEPPASVLEAAHTPISLLGFEDSASHYQKRRRSTDYPKYDPAQIAGIAENILLHQRSNGGWPENWDPQRVLNPEEKRSVWNDKARQDTSFDNHTTFTQIAYLASAHLLLHDERYAQACRAGLLFMLEAQHENGGFPHSYPGSQIYHHHTTFMDAVTPGALALFRRIVAGEAAFGFLDSQLVAKLREALRRGEQGLLRLQVRVDGRLTVWAGQYDRETNEPTTGRAYELPGLVSRESVDVVRYLMGVDAPSPDVVASIEAAIVWFQRSKLEGLRVEEFEAPLVHYEFHSSHVDRRVVHDPTAPPLWARFYEIDTNRPFMANRDGVKVYSLEQVSRERRTGYSWYGDYAARLLAQDYPAWRESKVDSLPPAVDPAPGTESKEAGVSSTRAPKSPAAKERAAPGAEAVPKVTHEAP